MGKTSFYRDLFTPNRIILPRQAGDNDRTSYEKRRFLQAGQQLRWSRRRRMRREQQAEEEEEEEEEEERLAVASVSIALAGES